MPTSHTQRYKEQGLCPRCGARPPSPGYSSCEQCRAYGKEFRRKRTEKRRAANLCTRCGLPAVKGKAFCQSCVDKATQRHNARTQSLKEQAVCVSCAKRPAAPGIQKCKECNDRHYAPSLKTYTERKAQGICVQCGKRPAAKGHTMCLRCLSSGKERIAQLRTERKAKGLCPRCGNVPDLGKSLCEQCLAKSRLRTLKKSQSSENYAIKERDGFSCRLCGSKSNRLMVHHIDGSGRLNGESNPDSNESLDNKLTLCYPCHSQIHSLVRRATDRKLLQKLFGALMSAK